MPAEQRGRFEKLKGGGGALRYRDREGKRVRARSPAGIVIRFPNKTAALAHYRDVIRPHLRSERPVVEYTLREFVPVFLERHVARDRTIDTLRERLGYPVDRDGETVGESRKRERHAVKAFGDVPLRDLEVMTSEIAAWYAALPERSRYGLMQALRQCLSAAVRWRHMAANPAVEAVTNRQPQPRTIRTYALAELDAIAEELSAAYRGLPAFAAATGLRPEEWAALPRPYIDRRAGVLTVARTVTGGKRKGDPLTIVELGKSSGSRREVPLTPRALEALDDTPARLDTPLIFPAPEGGPLHLDNFRRREWAPAIDAAAIAKPARIYDLRSTFASDSLAAGITVFELARVMGTSIRMIERHYGTLLGGATASIAARLAGYHAEQEQAAIRTAEPDC
jgi:integrase